MQLEFYDKATGVPVQNQEKYALHSDGEIMYQESYGWGLEMDFAVAVRIKDLRFTHEFFDAEEDGEMTLGMYGVQLSSECETFEKEEDAKKFQEQLKSFFREE